MISKTITFFFVIVLFATNSYSFQLQNYIHINDSLNHVINKPKLDTTQINSLLNYVRKNRRNLKDDYLSLLIELSERSKKINYKKGMMETYNYIGVSYRYLEDFNQAIIYHQKGLKLAEELHNNFFIMYANNNLGQVYRKLDKNDMSISCFHSALKMAETTNDDYNIAITQNSLGNAYVVQEDYEKALYYFRSSMQYGITNNKRKHLEINYGSLGELFLYMDQPDSALHYITKSVELAEIRGNKVAIALGHQLMAQVYEKQGKLKMAAKLFEQALEEQRKNKQERYVSYNLNFLGSVQIKLGQFEKAEANLLESREVAKRIGSIDNAIKANQALFDLYKKINYWEKATSALMEAESFKDSVLNEKNFRATQELETQYQTRLNEKKIELLTAENEIKNQRFILLLGGVIFFIGLVLTVLYIRNKQLIAQREQISYQLLRSQMNPHFLFNALGSIQNFMYRNDAKKAASYMGSFATLTRSILEFSSIEKIPLSREIETLKSYIELEKMRMDDGFEYQIIVDKKLDAEFINIPPLMIQPFVENAIKHGFKLFEKQALLTLKFQDKGDVVKIIIEDNGVGINSSINKSSQNKSMSMSIFRKRRKLIQKQYKKDLLLEITDLSEINKRGTNVKFELPVLD